MEDKKTWALKAPAIFGIAVLGILALIFVGGSNGGFEQLNAKVQDGQDGIHITNLENTDWTDCMVGLNGGDGSNFLNPPYQTRTNLVIPAGQVVAVPFQEITADDGTVFDVNTHRVNGTVIECFKNTTAVRVWSGGH